MKVTTINNSLAVEAEPEIEQVANVEVEDTLP